ncbi:MAG: hypothetical protein ACKV22_07430 [Bryobacteraceae bacterium]
MGVWRLGLLAAVAANVFSSPDLSFHNPLTSDLSVFYAGRMLAGLGLMVAIATFACSSSMGGRAVARGPVGDVRGRWEAA